MPDVSLQSALISSYLSDFSVKTVIGHDTLLYREIIAKHFFLIAIVILLSGLLRNVAWIDEDILRRASSGLVIFIYISCIYQLLNDYLDGLVISPAGLILFKRNNPFARQMSVIQRVAVESIQHEHRGIRESMFHLGNISIQVEDEKFSFRRVRYPLQTVSRLLKRKQEFTGNIKFENQSMPTTDKSGKYDLLLEALGEVMHEYIEKKDGK